MDITKFVVSSRETALLYGDYATYRSQLSRRLLKCRKRLNLATKNRGKYRQKGQVTSELMAENPEHLYLQLLTAERAWAHAMTMKSAHVADTKEMSGKTRSHIVSRLDKAARTAEGLVAVLSQGASTASETDVLEAAAYAGLLRGAAQFEKQSWDSCLRSYAVARVIYSALANSAKVDIFKDLLSETIDPSIRYAAYQLKTPRTLPISDIAQKTFPRSDVALLERVNKLDPGILSQRGEGAKKDAESAPRTLTWRSRDVQIEDANISVAWAAVESAKPALAERLTASSKLGYKDMAAAYDDILTTSQDAVDATKQAIDELKAEGVSQSDPRMQSLQITRTAVNYEMISWRIGRNRVLTGARDGALLDPPPTWKRQARKQNSAAEQAKQEKPGRQVARLKEKVVLYDGTLQSLESVKALPGVAADQELSAQLNAIVAYFTALRSLAIGRSYSLTGGPANALALTKYACDQCQAALPFLSRVADDTDSLLRSIDVSRGDISFLHDLLNWELERCRAVVEISRLRKETEKGGGTAPKAPLVERLGEYPVDGVDLDNIVVYPPRIEAAPAKPLFLDVAWNYIEYPDRQMKADGRSQNKGSEKPTEAEEKPQKRGWFGFGR